MGEAVKFNSNEIFTLFNESVGDLTSFLKPSDEKFNNFRYLTSKLFACLKENSGIVGIKDLVTERFDEEQIWAQIEQDNQSYLDQITKEVSKLSALSRRVDKETKKITKKSSLEDVLNEEDIEPGEEDEEEEDGEDLYDKILGPASSDEEDDDIDRLLGPREVAARHNLSTFEKEQLDLKEKISKLEDANLSKKPWKLIGEVTSDRRPANSLLEDHFQYDFVARPAQIIDEEVATKLEDLIKQRIKDGIWDDVERKVKPVEQPFEYKRRLILDQEKSKVGLGEIYEKDYLQRRNEDKTEEENETHKEIRKMMTSLFLLLDSLSSFNFTPKPPEPEIKIVKNLPAITAEEAIPVAISEAALLAPEEVLEKPKRPVKGATEKDTTDRKHDRRLKKKRQKIIAAKKAKKEPKVTSEMLKSKRQSEKLDKANTKKQFKPVQLKT